jgi:Tfp pilus assembly protein PilO
VSITQRDKKILMLLVPIGLIAAFWFLAFSPKRDEAASIQEQLSQAQTEQQAAESQAASVSGAKQNFAADYTTVIRLGKAVPSTVDMPSLLMQLDRAARGTGIDFDKVSTGERSAAPAPAPSGGSGSGSGSAQSGPGKAKQAAQGAANQASNTGTLNGAQPGGASSTTGTSGGASGAAAPGLESIPLDFTFHGTFFDLADFFHRMKRFVRVANDNVVVRGRLMTIDSFNWKAEPQKWPYLTAEVHASVYLAPKAEGVSAGATPSGPGATTTPAAAGGSAPAAPSSSTPATTAPAATVK